MVYLLNLTGPALGTLRKVSSTQSSGSNICFQHCDLNIIISKLQVGKLRLIMRRSVALISQPASSETLGTS